MDNKLNITAIVQARTTSSRFPRKVLQKINGKTIMQIIHSRLKKSNFIDKIVFAIPKNDKQRRMVEEIANKVSALIRGHLTRCRFKKLYFLH